MQLRSILAALLVLVSTHVRADDADNCVKSSGDTKIAACTRAIESGRWQGANLALAYGSRGDAKQAKGDLDGAIADYSRALGLDPRNASVYNNRGIAKKTKGDLDGAIVDFDRAVELDPRHVNAYGSRGIAKRTKGDIDGAIADFNRALELDPRSANAYNNRGIAKKNKGDLDGAIADYSRALELDSQYAKAFINRGHTRYYKGEFNLAVADFARWRELEPANAAYAAIWIYLARIRSGSDGKSEFVTNTAKLDASKWPAPVTALYLGKGTPAAVLSGAANPDPKTHKDQLCEANFYVGQWQLTKGDRARATSSLRTARDQCPKTFVEYTGAVYELKRLGMQ